MKKIPVLSALPLLAACLAAGSAWALDVNDLSQPESITVDPKTGEYFISNVNGGAADKDNNGYITKVSADGLVVVQKFIEAKPDSFELHAPKGLGLDAGVLYVTDIDTVKAFHPDTGELVRVIDLAPLEPKFLNDIAVDLQGRLYVSDMLGNKIICIDPKADYKAEIWKEASFLGQPNGLLFNRFTKGLMAAAWESGEIYELDRVGKIRVLRKELEGLDGITSDRKGTIYVSSFKKGEIYRVTNWGRGDLTLFRSGLNTPADIYYDTFHHELHIPLMEGNAVISIPVEQRQPRRRSSQGPNS